jgi:hypothetical protein
MSGLIAGGALDAGLLAGAVGAVGGLSVGLASGLALGAVAGRRPRIRRCGEWCAHGLRRVGACCRVAVSWVWARLWGRLQGRLYSPWRREPAILLTEADRAAVAQEFAQHAAAVRSQVTAFADELAGDDVLLRERLRRFEHPTSSSAGSGSTGNGSVGSVVDGGRWLS